MNAEQAQSTAETQACVSCPKCGATSGNNWGQCGGSCPMPGSPHYKAPGPTNQSPEELHDQTAIMQQALDALNLLIKSVSYKNVDPFAQNIAASAIVSLTDAISRARPVSSEDEPYAQYSLKEATRLAGLWRAGKMIGGDAQSVSVTLLNELEKASSVCWCQVPEEELPI